MRRFLGSSAEAHDHPTVSARQAAHQKSGGSDIRIPRFWRTESQESAFGMQTVCQGRQDSAEEDSESQKSIIGKGDIRVRQTVLIE